MTLFKFAHEVYSVLWLPIKREETVIGPFIQIVNSRDDKSHIFSAFDDFRIKTVSNEFEKLVIIASCRENRHMIHVFCYVALKEFRVSLIIYKGFLEFKILNKFAPLLNILLSFKLWISLLYESQKVFELFGVEKLLTIYYIELKKMECTTMLFRVKW